MIALLPGTLATLGGSLRHGSLLRTVKDLRAELEFQRRANAVRGIFDSFDAAARSAPQGRKLGYDHPEHASMYDYRLGELVIADYPVLYWFSRLLPELSSLFDFGGHVGLLYYGFARRLDISPSFRWLVCDMPRIIEQGRALAARSSAAPLQFTTAWEDGDGADLLLASGVLQYVEADLGDRLRSWKRLPKHLIVSNTPMYDGPPYVTLQNTYLSYNPYRIFNRAELIRSVEEVGYELRDAWRTERSLRLPLHPERTVESYQGLYFERRVAAERDLGR